MMFKLTVYCLLKLIKFEGQNIKKILEKWAKNIGKVREFCQA